MSTEEFDRISAGDEEVFAGLQRSVAGAGMATSVADVVALGRRTRTRHRAVAAGIGTSAAAIVAAIGVLAPSAGTGAGAAPNAAAQRAVTAGTESTNSTGTALGTGQILNIQEAGFSLAEQADGTVTMNLGNAFDPARLKAAMDKAGIPSAIVVQQLPDGWDLRRGVQCTPDPGVHPVGPSAREFFNGIAGPLKNEVEIIKPKIPAGVYITLLRFESHGRQMGSSFGPAVGRQTTCVPEYPVVPAAGK